MLHVCHIFVCIIRAYEWLQKRCHRNDGTHFEPYINFNTRTKCIFKSDGRGAFIHTAPPSGYTRMISIRLTLNIGLFEEFTNTRLHANSWTVITAWRICHPQIITDAPSLSYDLSWAHLGEGSRKSQGCPLPLLDRLLPSIVSSQIDYRRNVVIISVLTPPSPIQPKF
jgi:hypothetical protein